jgi:PP-loop superfamily ATP-utilizing enzyme
MSEQKKDAVVFNYGGGRQTVAMCIMIAKGVLPKPDIIVIADTGRENPSTWEYLETHMRPLMREHGLEIHIASHELSKVDLHDRLGNLQLPVFTKTGKMKHFCSTEWKKRVVRRYLRQQGIAGGTQWLGLAFDEKKRWTRVHNRVDKGYRILCPLVDLMINTQACLEIIKAANLPIPHHSSCFMCPNKRNAEWRHIKDNYPEEWQKAIEIDREIRLMDRENGVFLHYSLKPLEEADLAPDEGDKVMQQCSLGVCFV